MLKNLQKTLLTNKLVVFVILIGTLAWSSTIVRSGIVYDYGMGFWGANAHDGLWHIALSSSLADGSYEMPIFAGEAIKNYHIGFDLLLALIYKLTNISLITLYFQLIPPTLAILIGLLSYQFVYRWIKNKNAAIWSTIFVYFGGNLDAVVYLIHNGKLGGESQFWAQPTMLTLVNPPYALSLVFILLGLNILLIKKSRLFKVVILSLIFGLLVQIKIYAAVVVLFALFSTAIFEFIKTRKLSSNFLVFIGASIVSLFLFLPNLGHGNMLEVKPFWFLETMFAAEDRLNIPIVASAIVAYTTSGKFLLASAVYFVSAIIFIIGNFGIRLISLFHISKSAKNPKSLDIFMLSAVAIGFLMPLFFVQKATAWNTIQFFYYSLFFVSILAGLQMARILEVYSKHSRLIIIVVAFYLCFSTIGTLYPYIAKSSTDRIPIYKIEALKLLKNQNEGVVLAHHPGNKNAFVSALSQKPVWLEAEGNLDITGYDWKARKRQLVEVLQVNNSELLLSFLEDKNIKYVYWEGDTPSSFTALNLIYKHTDTSLYVYP